MCEATTTAGNKCGNELYFKIKPSPCYIMQNLCYEHAFTCLLKEPEDL